MNRYRIFRYIDTLIYILIMLLFHPLFFVNMYFNISQEKWLFFMVASLIYVCSIAISLVIDDSFESELKSFFRHFTITEFALIGFVITNLISTFLSDYPSACISGGVNGRYNGLVCMFFYLLVYFIIRNCYTGGEIIACIFCISSALVSLTAVCQYLGFDPIGMYDGVTAASVARMISTIGNRNIYASWLCLCVPAILYCFINASKKWIRILSGISLMICFAGGTAGNSDSFYLGIFFSILVLIFTGNLHKKNISRLLTALSLGLASDFLLLKSAALRNSHGIKIRESEGFTLFFESHTSYLAYAALAFLTAAIICFLLLKKSNSDNSLPVIETNEPNVTTKEKKTFISFVNRHDIQALFDAPKEDSATRRRSRKISSCILLAAIFLTFCILILNFPFEDSFGSYRGFIWNLSVNDFRQMNFMNKLFGYGPETIYIIFSEKYYDILVETTGVLYDNVHSEPLQYLMTSGILGVGFYLTFIISLIIRAVKFSFTDGRICIFLLPVCGYFAQSFVNIAQSATTPVFFIFTALTAGYMFQNVKD